MVDATITGSNFLTLGDNNLRNIKKLIVETASTVDAGDTFDIDLADYDGETLLGFTGCVHTTDNSVVATEVLTCAVSGTVVTVTVPVGTDDDKRVAELFYE